MRRFSIDRIARSVLHRVHPSRVSTSRELGSTSIGARAGGVSKTIAGIVLMIGAGKAGLAYDSNSFLRDATTIARAVGMEHSEFAAQLSIDSRLPGALSHRITFVLVVARSVADDDGIKSSGHDASGSVQPVPQCADR